MSGNIHKFSIHFAAVFGRVDYDSTEKTFQVFLDDAGYKKAVENYLSLPHVIQNADGDDLRTFHPLTVVPTENLESFKLALTRLWQNTGVYVDWSRPTV
jgi:hypothetical protein